LPVGLSQILNNCSVLNSSSYKSGGIIIGGSWNIRSISKKGRSQALADSITEHRFDFIGLQEMKKEKIDLYFLNFVAGNIPYNWVTLPARKTAGGILVGIRNDRLDIICY
jgi:exonuclease III